MSRDRGQRTEDLTRGRTGGRRRRPCGRSRRLHGAAGLGLRRRSGLVAGWAEAFVPGQWWALRRERRRDRSRFAAARGRTSGQLRVVAGRRRHRLRRDAARPRRGPGSRQQARDKSGRADATRSLDGGGGPVERSGDGNGSGYAAYAVAGRGVDRLRGAGRVATRDPRGAPLGSCSRGQAAGGLGRSVRAGLESGGG